MHEHPKEGVRAYTADWNTTLRKAPSSVSPRCEAMNLETLKVDFLKVNMTCNVSELYFDVETLVRHHHGRCVIYGLEDLTQETVSPPAATPPHFYFFYTYLWVQEQIFRL